MKVKDLYTDRKTKVFVVTNQDDEDELNWEIEPTDFDLLRIPNYPAAEHRIMGIE